MRSFFVLLMLIFVSDGSAQDIDVMAIEYPPFTSSSAPGGGIAFDLLNTSFAIPGASWRPDIVPPARARKRLLEGNWCASFYPADIVTGVQVVQLSKQTIRIGLLRRKAQGTFAWQSLQDLCGETVALLRTGTGSAFVEQFVAANKQVAFVDSIDAARQLVVKGRVDYAMYDNVSFEALESALKDALEFSETALLETKMSIFFNDNCHMPQVIQGSFTPIRLAK